MRPPASLSEAERSIWVHVVTSNKPEAFRPSDQALLMRHVETVAMSDHAAKKLAADIAKGRMPSSWLSVQERLTKLLITLGRQLRLSPLARTPHKNGRPEPVDPYGNGHAVSAYELMRLQDDPQ